MDNTKPIFMQKIFYFLFICLISSPAFAQNFFINFSGGRFSELIPLQTDSLYIEGGTLIREIAFKYDAQHRKILSRERRTNPAQNSEVRQIQVSTYSQNKFIFIDTTEWVLPSQNVFISRYTVDSSGGKPISFYGEIWNGNTWNGVQKDSFFYDSSLNLTERSTQNWDFVEMVWKYHVFHRYEYTSGGRVSTRYVLDLGNSIVDTLAFNSYDYTYNAAGDISSLIWKNGSPPKNIARETYSYDNLDNLDSLKIDNWNQALQIWQPENIYTLDDSPEQQITHIGNNFKLNNQSQWYLDSEAIYTPGPQIYTDEPSEVLTKKFNANSSQLQNYERQTTQYTDLPSGIIKGDLQRAFFTNGNWQNVLHVEAWQRKIESIGVQTPEELKVASCGFPNPLKLVDLPTFNPEIADTKQIAIFSLDGRLVLSQDMAEDVQLGVVMNSMNVYLLLLHDANKIVCAQKVFIH